MALDKMNVPKTITVGFDVRNDTYTKKLAYVIYTDAKGVLRKEKSWEGWRDKKIDPETYDNEPITGFVLNKKVGGNNYSWNPRNTYVRVFDPRGFEFEISIPNLLFILQESSSIKGKGLEGEFVYAWDGTELVLLPTTCQEYKDSTAFTTLQTKKITKNDMKEGVIYLNKENDRVMYLGRHDWTTYNSTYAYQDDHGAFQDRYNGGYYYNNPTRKTKVKTKVSYFLQTKKKHVFVYIDKNEYWIQDGFTKIGVIESPDVSTLYADKYDTFKNTCPNVGADYEVVKELYNLKDSLASDVNVHFNRSYRLGNDRYNVCYNSYSSDKRITLEHNKDHYVYTIDGDKLSYITSSYTRDGVKMIISREDFDVLVGDKYMFNNKNNGITLYEISKY